MVWGETTLSIHVATELSRRGRWVVLIDADPQGAAWANCRENLNFNVVAMPITTLHKEIDLLHDDYDEIIIDGPPRIAELVRS